MFVQPMTLFSEQAVAFLESDELEKEVNTMCDEARSKGITGVPMTIIDGKWAVSGGQSSDVFIQVRNLKQSWRKSITQGVCFARFSRNSLLPGFTTPPLHSVVQLRTPFSSFDATSSWTVRLCCFFGDHIICSGGIYISLFVSTFFFFLFLVNLVYPPLLVVCSFY